MNQLIEQDILGGPLDDDPGVLALRLEHVTGTYDDALTTIAELRARVAELEDSAQLAVRGFRRWKRNQGRRGDPYEAEHGMTDLGQAVWDLAELLHLN